MEQTKHEFEWMMDLVTLAGPLSSILEIGSREGSALLEMAPLLAPGAKIRSIDLGVLHPEWKNGASPIPGLLKTIKELTKRGYDADVHIGDSHSEEARAWAKESGPYDFIFIDANHNFEDVSQDWEDYGPLAPIIGFHDIAHQGGGPGKLWDKIKKSESKTREILSVDGIGLVWRKS